MVLTLARRSHLYMDQHIPLVKWIEDNGRGPSYLECYRYRLLPEFQEPLCEETLCKNVCSLQELLQPEICAEPLLTIVRHIPKRCQSRDFEEKILNFLIQSPEDGLVAQIFKWSRLGNHHHATWRPNFDQRMNIFFETPEETIEVARGVPKSIAYAMGDFAAVILRQCPAYANTMKKVMSFEEFWCNLCQLNDRVFRPHLAAFPNVTQDDIAKAVSLWQKKNRSPLYKGGRETPFSALFGILNKQTNSNHLPCKKYLHNTILASTFTLETISSAVEYHPHLSKKIAGLFKQNWQTKPKTVMKTLIKKHMNPQEIHHAASLLLTFLKPGRIFLVPLPVHFFKAQKEQLRCVGGAPGFAQKDSRDCAENTACARNVQRATFKFRARPAG